MRFIKRFKEIPATKINLEDRLFYLNDSKIENRISLPTNLSFVDPIYIQEQGPDSYRLILGFKDIEDSIKRKKDSSIPCLIIDKDTSIEEIIKFCIHRSRVQNQVSDFALGRLLVKIHTKTPFNTKLIDEIFHELELPNFSIISGIITKIEDKKTLLLKFVDLTKLSFTELALLSDQEPLLIQLLSSILDGFHLSGNKLSSLIILINELDKGFQITSSQLLEDKLLQQFSKLPANNLRYKNIKKYLLSLRFPRLNSLRIEWLKALKLINLPSGVIIKGDTDFEKDSLILQIETSNLKQLDTQLNQIQHQNKTGELKPLFDML